MSFSHALSQECSQSSCTTLGGRHRSYSITFRWHARAQLSDKWCLQVWDNTVVLPRKLLEDVHQENKENYMGRWKEELQLWMRGRAFPRRIDKMSPSDTCSLDHLPSVGSKVLRLELEDEKAGHKNKQTNKQTNRQTDQPTNQSMTAWLPQVFDCIGKSF